MIEISLDEKWTFRRGFLDSISMLKDDPGEEVNLPHDGMIDTQVTKDAPAGPDSGYFTGGLSNYTKMVFIPDEWKDDCVGLKFDGAMMNATVDINGSRVALQHNGYMPFYVDLTNYVTYGTSNRVTINVNTSMQPNSRWYTGSGLYRGVNLVHGPRIHTVPDGVFIYTKEITDEYAFLNAEVEVCNSTMEDHLAQVTLELIPEGDEQAVSVTKQALQVAHAGTGTARLALHVKNPKLWDADHPNLYRVIVSVRDMGVYRTHLIADRDGTVDRTETVFGIRTVSADSVRGLLINGKSVKLKGGCLHHDNGLLGSVTTYETEARKVRKLKEIGFNAIRTAHNPPSKFLVEACDRLGMYIFDEAFDAWFIGKRGGDYHQFFESDWEKDLAAFIKRDRIHPSVIMWSTGNEIPERGGIGNGYLRADQIAGRIHALDSTRPVSNGICSLWAGLDDELAEGQNQSQNAGDGLHSNLWETATEPFTNGLDIVGYNYMEDLYERDHEMFPERVILGSENFPQEIGFRWPFIESHPYVIGDFTWTAWDYIGEAGIGKAAYIDENDPNAPKTPWDLMPMTASPYPWRTANDADFDITGGLLPQGAYRSVVWGSDRTYLYSMDPSTYGKKELLSMWGFPAAQKNWNYDGYEGKPVELLVYSGAEEVEVLINGESIGKKPVGQERPFPKSVKFETAYRAGRVEAVSYRDGREVSRDVLVTAGAPAQIRITAEKTEMCADGHDLIYVGVEILDSAGIINPVENVKLTAKISGPAYLAGFGSGNPVTDEKYSDNTTVTYRGKATAIIRSAYEPGIIKLTVSTDGFDPVEINLNARS